MILVDDFHKYDSILTEAERRSVVRLEARLLTLQIQLQQLLDLELVSLSPLRKAGRAQP